MKNNFLQRAITGILFVAIIVGCILYDPLAFGTLFVIVSALTIREFGHLVNQSGEVSINRTITMLGGAYLFLAIMGFCIDAAGSKIFIPYLILIIYLMVSELYLKKKNPVLNWAYSMLSQMYIALPFAMLNVLAFQNDPEASSVSYNPILPLSIFVFLWLNDTGHIVSDHFSANTAYLNAYHLKIMGRFHWRRYCSHCLFICFCLLLPHHDMGRMGGTGIGSCHFRDLG